MSRWIVVAALLAWSAPSFAGAANCPASLPQNKLNACWVQAYEAADEQLDRLLRDLRKSLADKTWTHLAQSQDYWEKSRTIDCKVEASFLDGPAREAVRYGCSEKRTRERIRQLRYYLCPRYNVTGQCDAERLYD